MKLIYHVRYDEDFEADAFFDIRGEIITAWDLNDAEWREEYMHKLIAYLDGNIVNDLPDAMKESAIKQIHEWFGV